jgi:class 3 adenylate cyclase
MSGERIQERVRDLLADAEASRVEADWAGMRGFAQAALALAPDSAEARRLLDEAGLATPSEGERRQLTVMFCDVVGSTAITHERDPELVREVLRTYQATSDDAVRRYDGRIARFIGDGILAYFGHPVAHEDDARRAVKAGLDLLEALRPVTEEVRQRYDVELAVRVAVHTGVVVLADMGSASTPDRDAIVGETPNVAARLQDQAAPGTLLVSRETYELVRGWFLVAPLGELALRGLTEPVGAYQVVAETEIESRVQAQADLSPFVGRELQVALLIEAWQGVWAGGNRTIALTGQAGVGKSRLADVVRRRVQADDGATLVANCSTYHGTTALFPVRRLLERAAGIDTRQVADHALPRLWSAMEAVGRADLVPLFADLLELPPTPWCPAPELDGSRRHAALLQGLVDFVAASAARSPLLVVVDDVQWADASTLELVGRLVTERVPGLLLLVTARDEFTPPRPGAQHEPVERLSPVELEQLAQRLPDGRRLGRSQLDRAIERSDGIPFFLEELLRSSALAQGPAGEHASADIPSALRDLLLARFAAPGVDLHIAQLLATIGGEATASLVAATVGCAPGEVDGLLSPMVEAGIVVPVEGEPPTYRFRHHLLGDLAYDTQLRPARQRAHAAVADALRSGASVGVAAAPAVVAHHLELAGRFDEAVEALLEAAEESFSLGANEEVTDLLAQGLDLVPFASPDRQRGLEFRVRLLRGTCVASTLGFTAPQAIADYEACQALVAAVDPTGYIDDLEGEDSRLAYDMVTAAVALWSNLFVQGRLDEGDLINRNLAERFRPGGQARAYTEAAGGGFSQFFRGDWSRSHRALADLLEISRDFELPGRSPNPNDEEISGLVHLGFTMAIEGRLDEARAILDDALERADQLTFPVGPFTVCYTLGMRTSVELVFGDTAEAARSAARLQEIAERHGFTFWSLFGGLYQGLVDLASGDGEAGPRVAMIIGMLRAVGMLVWLPAFLSMAVDLLLAQGDVDGAVPMLVDAEELAERTGAHFWSAELDRQRGEVAFAQGDDRAVHHLRAAAARAVAQGAPLFEVRARTALCRHVDDADERTALADLLERLPQLPDGPVRVAAEAVLDVG